MENILTIYGSFIKEIKDLIYRRQYETLKKVISVATYSYHDNLPEDMRGLLPSPDEIANIVAGIDGKVQL